MMGNSVNMSDYLNMVRQESPEAASLLLANFLNNDGVFVPRAWLKLLDGNAYHALVMGRVMFWADINTEKRVARMQYKRNGQLWMVKTFDEIADEIGLNSSKTVRNALENLRDKQFIFLESHHSPFHKTRSGNFLKVAHIRPNWKVIMSALDEWIAADNVGYPVAGQPENPPEGEPIGHPSEGESLIQVNKSDKQTLLIAFADTTADAVGNCCAQKEHSSQLHPSISETKKRDSSPTKEELTLPAYTQLMLMVTRSKWAKVSKTLRADVDTAMRSWDEYKYVYVETLSAPQMYDKDIVFAAWIREVVVPEMNLNTNYRVSKTKFLNDTRNYIRFQKWLKSEYGQAFAKRVKLGITSVSSDTNANEPPQIIEMPDMGGYID